MLARRRRSRLNGTDGSGFSFMVAHIEEVREVNLAAAATTTGAYVTLLTDVITLAAADKLLIDAYIAAVGTAGGNQNGLAQITINGVPLRTAGQFAPTAAAPSALAHWHITAAVTVGTNGLIVGPNGIALQWRDDNGFTLLTCDPAVDGQDATLRLQRWKPN